MHRPSNSEIAEILYEIAQYLEIQDIPFKPRVYTRTNLKIKLLP